MQVVAEDELQGAWSFVRLWIIPHHGSFKTRTPNGKGESNAWDASATSEVRSKLESRRECAGESSRKSPVLQ
jgi:hypothetical protein